MSLTPHEQEEIEAQPDELEDLVEQILGREWARDSAGWIRWEKGMRDRLRAALARRRKEQGK